MSAEGRVRHGPSELKAVIPYMSMVNFSNKQTVGICEIILYLSVLQPGSTWTPGVKCKFTGVHRPWGEFGVNRVRVGVT